MPSILALVPYSRLVARGSENLQRRVAVAGRTERVDPGEIGGVVEMQVGQEDLGHPRRRNLHDVVVDSAARPGIEDERVAIAEFDKDAGAFLVWPDDVAPTGAHERDPHFAGIELLSGVEPQIRPGDDFLERNGLVRRIGSGG
jgi:hypothetical protein